MTKNASKTRSGRSNPLADTKELINGYPSTLVIYKIAGSEFYQSRYFYQGKYIGRSTKTTDKSKAKQEAIKLFQDVILNSRQRGVTTKSKSFGIIGNNFINDLEASANKLTYKSDKSKFVNHLLPFFGDKDVSLITYSDINNYLAELNKLNISAATKKHHLVVLRKIFKFCIANGIINNLPTFPQIKGSLPTAQKRDYLTFDEYKSLVSSVELNLKKNKAWRYRYVPITIEMKFLIQFMVNSFIRPSDLRVLKHIHIKEQIDTETGVKWLVLSHPATKTNATEVQSMPTCADVYRRLIEGQKENALYKNNGYVFLPQYENRNTAMGLFGKLFAEIVKESGLEERTGKNITLYSLRHTAIMLRLIKGDQIDLVSLARNARTSAEMIDKFYAAHLITSQVRRKIHSFAKNSKKLG